jgi:hypothetical protein
MKVASKKTKVVSIAPMIKKNLTYAEIWNARFNQNASVFVSAKKRLDDYQLAVPGSANELQHAITDFKMSSTFVKNKKWQDITLARAHKVKLKDIRIDDTMNRPLDWEHVRKIVKNFCATRVLAINVYEDPSAPGCYIAWDGQHTTIVLYIISVLAYGEAIGNVEVPVVVTPGNNKEEIRENFIVLNTDEGKLPLSTLAIFEQMIYGVTVDHSNNPKWNIAAKKWEELANVGIFLTSTDYRNTTNPGALTHVETIDSESLDLIKKFATYWKYRRQHQDDPVNSKELIMVLCLLKAADADGITWSDTEIKDIVDIFWNCFNCEFTGETHLHIFWKKLEGAYQNWYDTVYRVPGPNEPDLRPKRKDMTRNGKHQETFGTTFMIRQLEKSGFGGKLPDYEHEFGFNPSNDTLW